MSVFQARMWLNQKYSGSMFNHCFLFGFLRLVLLRGHLWSPLKLNLRRKNVPYIDDHWSILRCGCPTDSNQKFLCRVTAKQYPWAPHHHQTPGSEKLRVGDESQLKSTVSNFISTILRLFPSAGGRTLHEAAVTCRCKTHVCHSIGEFRYQKMLSQLPQHTLLAQEKPRVSGKTSYIITMIYLHLPNGPNFRLNCEIRNQQIFLVKCLGETRFPMGFPMMSDVATQKSHAEKCMKRAEIPEPSWTYMFCPKQHNTQTGRSSKRRLKVQPKWSRAQITA